MILIVICLIIPATAELSDVETLRNVTSCDLASVDLTCVGDEIIAVQSLQYAYDVRCDGTCCNTYTSTDCLEYASEADIQTLRRTYSGHSTCSLSSFQDKRSFCAYGVKDTSYVFLQYFCIPKTRVTDICSTVTKLKSDNLPLYITNENYPSVTTRHESCSCSLEIYSCTANIQVYTLDTDLYLDESHCEQSLKFVDISNNTVTELNCESHYKNEIEINKVARHYTRVDFINNSTADQEGYFFIGLDSTEPLVSFVLNCGAERVTWCSECGVLPNITDGTLTLVDATNSSYGATAGVVCNTGYETNTPTVACLANGTWSVANCFKTASCAANEQRCDDGVCIPDSDSCSSIPNCNGGSNENCTVTTTPVQPNNDLEPVMIIAIVIGSILACFLIQLVVSLVLYKKDDESGRSVTNVVLGSIPVVGLVFICYYTWTICKNNKIGSAKEDNTMYRCEDKSGNVKQ